MSQFVIGIDLGGTTSKMAVLTPEGEILSKWSIPTDIEQQGQNIVPNIIQSIKEKIYELDLSVEDLIGIGMGSPGAVNHKAQTVIGAYNLNWETEQKVGEQFKIAFDAPFCIDNDANIAALGEQWMGAGKGHQNVVMVTLGTGVGGGIVVQGDLLHGTYGSAGEIGHIIVDPDTDIQCTCGNHGCLEALASATGIVNLAKKYMEETDIESQLKEAAKVGLPLDARLIFDCAQSGDALSQQIVDQFCRYLGLACGHLSCILNPSRIILGGGVAQSGEMMRAKVESYMLQYTFPAIRNHAKLVLATLGNDAGIYGAARLVHNYIND